MHIFIVLVSLLNISLLACSGDPSPQTYRVATDQSKVEKLELDSFPRNISHYEIVWNKPQGWVEKAGQGMRLCSFYLPDISEDAFDVSVIYLKGKVGGELPNVNRWRNQILLPPWTEETFTQQTRIIDAPLGKSKLVSFSNNDKTIAAAMLPHKEGIWFIKMTGKESLVKDNMGAFIELIQSVNVKE